MNRELGNANRESAIGVVALQLIWKVEVYGSRFAVERQTARGGFAPLRMTTKGRGTPPLPNRLIFSGKTTQSATKACLATWQFWPG